MHSAQPSHCSFWVILCARSKRSMLTPLGPETAETPGTASKCPSFYSLEFSGLIHKRPGCGLFFCQKSWDSRTGWKSGQHPDIWYFWLAWKLVSAIGFSDRYFSTPIFPHASIFSLFPVVAKILAFQGWTKDYLRPDGGSSDEAETNYVNCFSKTSLFRPKIIASQTAHLSTK